jgi:hypothetical protein
MAVSNLSLLSGASLFTDTVNSGVGVVVKASSTVLYELELDNTANAAASYTKLYNTGTTVIGTTIPDCVYLIPAATKITQVLPGGVTFGTALSVCTTTAGGTVGSTGPTSSVVVKLVYV